MYTTNILIVGVGGQGTLLASRILGELFMRQDLDVKLSEVHGMAQRGGSVVTYVRAGEKVASPIITPGEADMIISFELLEALRWHRHVKKGGRIVTSTQRISPMPVITGAAEYPENIIGLMNGVDAEVVSLDAVGLAREAGSPRSANVVMLGAASRFMRGGAELWEDAMRASIRPAFLDMNLKAFELGRKSILL